MSRKNRDVYDFMRFELQHENVLEVGENGVRDKGGQILNSEL